MFAAWLLGLPLLALGFIWLATKVVKRSWRDY